MNHLDLESKIKSIPVPERDAEFWQTSRNACWHRHGRRRKTCARRNPLPRVFTIHDSPF